MSIVGVRTELEITADAHEDRSSIKTTLIQVMQEDGAPVESNTVVADFTKYFGKALNPIANRAVVRYHKTALNINSDGIPVPPPLVPPVFTGPIPALPLVISVLMTPVDYSTYFTGAVSYALAPLPAGLAFDTVTGILSGTPTAAAVTAATVSATNPDGSAPSNAFDITVA